MNYVWSLRSISYRLLTAIIIALFAVNLTPANPAHALACTAIASGNWNVAGNWSCGMAPGIADTVAIGTPFTITLTANESAANVTVNSGGILALSSFTLTLDSASSGMIVNNGGILDAGTGIVNDNAAGGAPFTLAAGATLQTANSLGIVTGVALTGSIQTRGLRTYTAGADYVYNGTVNQDVGNGLTQNTPRDLTINNPGNTVSLGAVTTITRSLMMTAGSLSLAADTTVGDVQGTANITKNTAGAATLTIGSDNAFLPYYSGKISDGIGTVALTKVGPGYLILSGNNTYSGTTTLSAGTLSLDSATAIGTGTFTINAGTTVANTSGGAITLSTNNPMNWNGNFSYDSGNLLNLGTGAVTLNAAVTVSVNGSLTVGGVIGGPFRLTLIKPLLVGNLTLNGANTHSGTTLTSGTINIGNAQAFGNVASTINLNGGSINNTTGAALTTLNYAYSIGGNVIFVGTNNLNIGTGTVTLTGNRTITVTANTLTISGIIGPAAARTLTKAGAGTLTLSGANIHTGGVTLTAGTLNINNAQALGTIAGTFIINGGTIDNTSGAAITTLNYPQTWGGDFAFSGSNSLNLGTGAVTLSASRIVTANANTLTVGGIIGPAAARKLTKAGAGALTLSGANIHTGGVTLTAGTLNINNTQALGTIAGTFIINGGTIDNISGAAITTLNYPQTWGGDFAFSGSNSLNLGTGAVTLSASRTVTANANTLTVGGTISPNTVDLTKQGAGTLSFGSNAVNLSSVIISAGTLVSTSVSMNLAGDFTNSSVFTHNSGTVNFNGAVAQSITGATTFNNLILNNANGLTINATETVNGILTFTNGRINTGANVLIVGTGGSIAGAAAGRYVNGFLQKNFVAAAGQNFSFPVGNAATYAPINLTNLNVTTSGGIIASTTAGEHPNIATSGIYSALDVNRYWTLAPTGAIAFTTYDATLNFVTADVDGGANTNNFIVQEFSGGTWSTPTTASPNPTNIQASGLTALGSFAVGERNYAPTDIALSNNTVNENQPANTAVGTLTAADPNTGEIFTFSLSCLTAGADDASFNILGTNLRASAVFDFEVQNVYNICVRVTDQGGLTYDKNFVVNVTNVNEAPIDIALSNNSINENQPANTVVGILSATDPDTGATFTFTLACTVAGPDDASFNILGTNLRTSASFDFETQNVYNICVRVTDQGGLTYDKNFIIIVSNVNEVPTDIALSNNSIAENNIVNAVVGILSATDVDTAETFVFSLICAVPGVDDASFNILGTNLRASVVFDYETINSYSICIRVTDSGNNTLDKNFTITITDLDEIQPAVTIDQAIGQVDPTNTIPVNFTVVFSEPIVGFIATDIALSGTALPTTAVVTEIAPNDGTTYNVAVSGMTITGTVIASVNAGVAADAAGNGNTTSISTDNIVNFDISYPVVLFNADTTPANSSTLTVGPVQITVAFNKDVKNDASAGAANNIVNYLLVEAGVDLTFNTLSCLAALAPDDVQIPIDSATYTNNGSGPFVATLNINGGTPLPVGNYRLFICGTTSIEDLANNELNNGLSDPTLNFIVTALNRLPDTGFPMNEVTTIPHQPAELKYASYSDLQLEIPKLNLKLSIVGVPLKNGGWDVTWLNRDAGWLNGSAFPTWNGNSVITGHVWDALNRPGPFAELKKLKYGDRIKVHAFGQVYTYEIRESKLISSSDKTAVFKHQEKSWITLITCEDYKEKDKKYLYRRMVRAVLISMNPGN